SQSSEINQVIQEAVDQKRAKLHVIMQPEPMSYAEDLPQFQRRNWQLAHHVFTYLVKRDGLQPLTNRQLRVASHIYIPARMEIISFQGKTVILDGAHNPQKLQALVRGIRQAYPKQAVACMVSFVSSGATKIRPNLEVLRTLST